MNTPSNVYVKKILDNAIQKLVKMPGDTEELRNILAEISASSECLNIPAVHIKESVTYDFALLVQKLQFKDDSPIKIVFDAPFLPMTNGAIPILMDYYEEEAGGELSADTADDEELDLQLLFDTWHRKSFYTWVPQEMWFPTTDGALDLYEESLEVSLDASFDASFEHSSCSRRWFEGGYDNNSFRISLPLSDTSWDEDSEAA